ncbi:MAG TPA: hypothetical protein DCZ44_01315 [Flavobacteriaceae bacterium]|nr:hypothetical protein [Flavobacteriaceae bacterium]
MCYDIKASLEAQKSRAERSGNLDAAGEIETLLRQHTKLPRGHINGFEHPILGLYTSDQPDNMSLGRWGLIPYWFRGKAQELKFNTLNARSESMFEKAAFAQAAEQHRGILLIDGFYEHQHRSTGIYPHFIYRKDQRPMALACICAPIDFESHPLDPTQDPRINRGIEVAPVDKLTAAPIQSSNYHFSFSIVTIAANALMSDIHNNPKIKQARMPLILTPEMEDQWLCPEPHQSGVFISEGTQGAALVGLSDNFVSRSQQISLEAHTVAPLRKKSSTEKDASAPYQYPELEQGWDLFSGFN